MLYSTRPILLVAPLLLAGCEMLGVGAAEKQAASREAEGRAVGGACRHAGRAIEDCYSLNRKADKAAVFAGWREMNDYMRENKLESVTPVGPAPKAEVAMAEPEKEAAHEKPAEDAPAAETPKEKPARPARKTPRSHDS